MKVAGKSIPKALIYEMVDGQPIYYDGYKDYLKGTKVLEQLIGSNYLQSMIISQLVFFLMSRIGEEYQILTNELGLQLSKEHWRIADIAIVEKSKLSKADKTNKYLAKAPKVVIEIDTKASIEELVEPMTYFHQKTDQLLEFGVEKVIWIFTDSQKIMIAEAEKNWEIQGWNTAFEILDGLPVTIGELIDEE